MAKKLDVPLFIDNERAKGKSDLAIKNMLVEAGWHIDIINEAIKKTGKREPMSVSDPFKQDDFHGIPKKPIYIAGGVFLFLIVIVLFI